jgi:hypothetical protein
MHERQWARIQYWAKDRYADDLDPSDVELRRGVYAIAGGKSQNGRVSRETIIEAKKWAKPGGSGVNPLPHTEPAPS